MQYGFSHVVLSEVDSSPSHQAQGESARRLKCQAMQTKSVAILFRGLGTGNLLVIPALSGLCMGGCNGASVFNGLFKCHGLSLGMALLPGGFVQLSASISHTPHVFCTVCGVQATADGLI